MKRVVPNGKSDPYSRLNEPQSVNTSHFDDFMCYGTPFFVIQIAMYNRPKIFMDVPQDLCYVASWISVPIPPIFKVKWALMCVYPQYDDFCVLYNTIILVIRILTSKMTKSFVGVNLQFGYECGRPSRPVWPILKVRQASKRAYTLFPRFLCAITHHFFEDLYSDIKIPKK